MRQLSCISIQTHTRTHTHTHTHTHTCTHAHTHTCTHTHTCMHAHTHHIIIHTWLYLHTAQISSRQLEADKKYLEEELKGGKRRKSSAPSQSTCAKEDLTSEPGAAVPIARPSLCSQPHRVINILEDLDKENFFNPKDSRGEKHTVSLNKKSERLHEDRDVSCVHVCVTSMMWYVCVLRY